MVSRFLADNSASQSLAKESSCKVGLGVFGGFLRAASAFELPRSRNCWVLVTGLNLGGHNKEIKIYYRCLLW